MRTFLYLLGVSVILVSMAGHTSNFFGINSSGQKISQSTHDASVSKKNKKLKTPASEKPIFDTLVNDGEFLDWDWDRMLTWDDYLGPADVNSDAAATTSTTLGIEYKIRNNNVFHRIICRFSKVKSWGRHKTKYILAHEQAHFDITEIFARKLNKAMLEYRFNPNTFKKDLDKIYNEVVDAKLAYQNRYDKETDHSRNKKVQEEWLVRIEEDLVATDAWSNYN